jgi:UDP-glucose 4-epimerase
VRVLVTGGAGYIGSVITAHLLDCGHQPIVVDNLSRGHRDAVPVDVPFVEADLADTSALARIFATYRVDAVMHMAAFAYVGESVNEPALYYRNNVGGGLSLLEAMARSGVSQVVFSSTCAVYGEPKRLPIDEAHPLSPASPYGETKLAIERALHWYRAAYGLRFVSLRYFNAAGGTQNQCERHDPEPHLIPLVLQTAAGRRPDVTIFGADYPTPDGTCVRDYVHVTDIARAHVLALSALASGQRGSDAYNLGCGGAGYSVREVIDIAREVTGRPITVKVGPRRAGDPAILVASSEKAARELGWTPQLQDLRVIIDSAWQWMSEPIWASGPEKPT